MKNADDIKKIFDNAVIQTDANQDKKILEKMTAAFNQTHKAQSEKTGPKIGRIIMRSPITKLAAAAVILIVIVLGLREFGGTNAWADILMALENVKNVHIVEQYVQGNGKEVIQLFWLRKPDGLREQGPGYEKIDNGKERIYFNTEKKEAQISESWLKDAPVISHYMFENVQMFGENADKRIKIIKLAQECNDVITVYSLYSSERVSTPEGKLLEVTGKAWVDSATMLPVRIEAELIGKAEPNEAQRNVMTFDYAPIEDEVFAINIPQDYKQLRKESAFITGRVLDENGGAIEGAIVVVGDKAAYKTGEEFLTDKNGNFAIKLSPLEYKRPAYPLMIRAYKKDDPSKVAWTIIQRPLDKTKYSLEIRGKVGQVRGDDVFLDASGVELQMEPAGRIYGKVTDEDGKPIQNAKVSTTLNELHEKRAISASSITVRCFGGTGEENTATATTDNEGRYEITNIPRFFEWTVFNVTAEAAGYVTDKGHFRTTGPLESQNYDFKLYKALVTVKGIVKDNYGEKLGYREIIIDVNNKRYLSLLSTTDKEGKFVVKGCPDIKNFKVTADLGQYPFGRLTDEEFKKFIYYAPVSKAIDYQEGKKEYEVELIAERPENVLEIEVRNSAGELLPYFPIEIRAPGISTGWQIQKNLVRRTDEQGRCRFIEIPNIQGLEIILHGGRSILNEKLDGEIKKIADENKRIYFWNEITVEIVEGQKEYKIKATALTQDEWSELQKKKGK